MKSSEVEICARIRASERLAREYEEIGDIEGSLRCATRVQSLKSGLVRRKEK